jgi:3-polyprenyl-4-hydroxybenzoate decarboxylase
MEMNRRHTNTYYGLMVFSFFVSFPALVCMPVSGNCRFHAYISILKRAPGHAKNAICAATWCSRYLY